MDDTQVQHLVENYCQEAGADMTICEPGKWQIQKDSQTILVSHFHQRSRWEGLTTLVLTLDLGDPVKNLKYQEAWTGYPRWDCVRQDSFTSTINYLLKRRADDLKIERLIYPSRFVHTGL